MPTIGINPGSAGPRLGFGSQLSPLAVNQGTDISVKQDRNPLGSHWRSHRSWRSRSGRYGCFVDSGCLVSDRPAAWRHKSWRSLSTGYAGTRDFYHDYKGGIEATSGVMGIVASDLVARRLTAPAGAFMGFLRTLPYARRIATLDEQYNNALGAVRAIDTNLASRGALGAEQYVGRSVVDHSIFDSATGGFVNATEELSRRSAVFSAKGLGAAKNMLHAGVTEAVMATTLNQNGFLYDDSAAHNMAWMGLGLAVAGGAGWLQGAYRIRKFVNSDEIRRTFANALDPGTQEESRLLWHGKKVEADDAVSFLGGIFSDRVTNLTRQLASAY
jgi:hypothetical protein